MFDPEDILFVKDSCCICGNDFAVEWSDYHGEGVCIVCGTPYQLYHYDANDKRIIGTLPMFALRSDFYHVLAEYWDEVGRNMGLGTYLGRSPYREQRQQFDEWFKQSEWVELVEG